MRDLCKASLGRVAAKVLLCLLGAAILAFGLCHIHAKTGISEGGVLGLSLWLGQTLGLSPAIGSLILNLACYLLGFKVLGLSFIAYSAVAGGGFSLAYGVFERMPPVLSFLGDAPLLAAVLGAIFVGVGVGLCVIAGGAPSGDDALAMSLSSVTKKDIRIFYLLSDVTVLALSLTYIPLSRIAFSLVTVVLSGQIIGWMTAAANKILNKKSKQ